jgi:hypothetical protein
MLAEFEIAKNEGRLLAECRNPKWRLSHLYWIVDKDGKRVLFVPNEEQTRLYTNMWYRNVILKARQLGFSTVIQILMLDCCLFKPNISAAVIAQDKDAANIIFRKIKFAYDNLPIEVSKKCFLKRDSASELIFSNGSSLRVATSVRSQTLQILHVYEFGKICAKFPDKAREVITGSLPAAE